MTEDNSIQYESLNQDAPPAVISAWVEKHKGRTSYKDLGKICGVDGTKLRVCHRIYREADEELKWLVNTSGITLAQTEAVLRLPREDWTTMATAIVHESEISKAPFSIKELEAVANRRRENPDQDIVEIIDAVCGKSFTISPQIATIGSVETMPMLYRAAWMRKESLADYCAEAPTRLAQLDLESGTRTELLREVRKKLSEADTALQKLNEGETSP